MSKFAIRYPYFVVVCCLIVAVLGLVGLARMPVDLFPNINIPIVAVATFYSGMPPEQVENDITGPFERFFTLASNVDHIESRSLPGVSLIRVYFHPGTNADAAVTSISNLAMADLRRLPPGTLPPIIQSFDASSLPVCLVSLKGEGLSEARLRDIGQYDVRNQIANVRGASVPQPFGGRYRQIMVYVDPLKMLARQLSPMDVVKAVNESNLILPAGDVVIGPFDYSLYTNAQVDSMAELNQVPLKTVNNAPVLIQDVGKAEDASSIQYNVVRVDGQRSVYLPVLKQGGANTIAVVNGIKDGLSHLLDVPKNLVARVVFDQSVFVKTAIFNLIHEGLIGMLLTGLMILIFLGNAKATLAVFLSIPLSALATFFALSLGDATVNTMVLGGLALAFSRLIDNSVVVLENIFRHLEMGSDPVTAAQEGGREVALAVLAATLTTAVVFFPVTLLYGVSKFLFSAMALSVVISLFASYVVAMTVVPLFCAKFMRPSDVVAHESGPPSGARQRRWGTARFNRWFNDRFHRLLWLYGRWLRSGLARPVATLCLLLGISLLLLGLFPLMQFSYFPRTDPGQFEINVKAQSGLSVTETERQIAQVEDVVRHVVSPDDLGLVVSNIGATADFSALYTPNSSTNTAFVEVGLKKGHRIGSYEYMSRVRAALRSELPQVSTYFQTGGLVDAVVNLGLPAPIDVQVSGSQLLSVHQTAVQLAQRIRSIRNVEDVYIPQDIDAPALKVDVDRIKAAQLGLTEKSVVSNVITALTSNGMIAPSYWIDPHSGNAYYLTVQYFEGLVHNLLDLKQVPIRSPDGRQATTLDNIAKVRSIQAPNEVDHYQLGRVMDVFVSTRDEDLSRVGHAVRRLLKQEEPPEGVRVHFRGSIESMNASFAMFAVGLLLSTLLVYFILVAQFASWLDPLLILLAIPSGLTGVVLTLWLTATPLNVMSLMGVVMLVGIAVSNSILIVEFSRVKVRQGVRLHEAVLEASQARLRPILMTSLATIIGLLPMALKLGEGSESYAPLARAVVGGLSASVLTTVFIVPAAYYWAHRGEVAIAASPDGVGL